MNAGAQNSWPSDWPSYESVVAIARAVAPYDHEDRVQEAFARGLAYVKRTGATLTKAWFRTAIKNHQRDDARRDLARPKRDFPVGGMSAYEDPRESESEDVRMMGLATEELLGQISMLPKATRELLQLRYFQSKSVKEIAKLRGVSASTIERQMHAAYTTLNARMRTQDGQLHPGVMALATLGGVRPVELSQAGVAQQLVGAWKIPLLVAACLMAGVPWLVSTLSLSGSPVQPVAAASVGAVEAVPGDEGAGLLAEPETSNEDVVPVLSASDRVGVASDSGASVAAAVPGAAALGRDTEEATIELPAPEPFRIVLTVNGQPATVDWKPRLPRFDPDRRHPKNDPPTGKIVESETPGEFLFNVSEHEGLWLFRVINSQTGAGVYIHDLGRPGTERRVEIDCAPYVLPASADLSHDEVEPEMMMVVGDAEPGVWVLGQIVKSDESWCTRQALVGPNRVMHLTGSGSWNPDAWHRVNDLELEVPPGG